MNSVYLETTVISYAAGRPSKDLLVLAHQKITLDWWKKVRPSFACFLSPIVLDEISRGDPLAVKRRKSIIRGIPVLDAHDTIGGIAEGIVAKLRIPERAELDAFHIAFAAFHEIRFLVTWNCTHIANASHYEGIREALARWNLQSPTICTPEELGGNP